MSTATSETSSSIDETQVAARKTRIATLARMVFDLKAEGSQNGANHDWEGLEDAGLIAALRVCRYYTRNMTCLPFDDLFVIQVEGIDGHTYLIQFSLAGPRISIHAARVKVTKLSMPASQENGEAKKKGTFCFSRPKKWTFCFSKAKKGDVLLFRKIGNLS